MSSSLLLLSQCFDLCALRSSSGFSLKLFPEGYSYQQSPEESQTAVIKNKGHDSEYK